MYKGHKIIRGTRFYQIRDKTEKVCGIGAMSYLEERTEKEVISEMLSRREPKPPHKRIETEVKNGELHVDIVRTCAECGCRLGRKSDFYKFCRCPNCGQEIDWSEI